jgi:hypothetical protein
MGGALVHTYFANTSSDLPFSLGMDARRDTFPYSPATLLHTAILCSVLHPAKPPTRRATTMKLPLQKSTSAFHILIMGSTP